MPESAPTPGALWRFERPDEKLRLLRERCSSFPPGYEELLERPADTDGHATIVHTRRLTPLGSVVQVFESEAFFETPEPLVRGFMKFYATETIDTIGETPISTFYQLYRNAGPVFEFMGRKIIQYHADHADPTDPRAATLSGLYRETKASMLHLTAVELATDWRGGHRLGSLIKNVEEIRTHADRFVVHSDNPHTQTEAPSLERILGWKDQFEEEIAVQMANQICYLTLSIQPATQNSVERTRVREYIYSVAEKLDRDGARPVLVIDAQSQEARAAPET
jgi:hypothetical protein